MLASASPLPSSMTFREFLAAINPLLGLRTRHGPAGPGAQRVHCGKGSLWSDWWIRHGGV